MRTAITLMLVLVLLVSAGCGRRYTLTGGTTPDGNAVSFQPADVHVVYAAPTSEDATLALAGALRARDFTITEMQPGVIVASATSRRLTVTVAVLYTERGAVIRYVQSDGLRIESSSTSRYYDTMTRRLADAIGGEITRPARERAAHELAVARAARPVVVAPPPVGVVVGGGAYVGGGYVAGHGGYAPSYGGPLSCEASVERYGHSRSSTIHCSGADPWCADAVLRTGHNPTNLMFCRGVEPNCAVRLLEEGHHPTALSRCR